MRPTCLFPFLLLTSLAFGQNLHEVKTDLVSPFARIANLCYEFKPEGRLGVEVNFWYRWAEPVLYYVPPRTYITTTYQVLITTIAAKYYFSHKQNGTGLYLGGYLRQDILASQPDARYQFYALTNYFLDSDNGKVRRYQRLRLALGGLTGYKHLIGKHVVLEGGVGLDFDLSEGQRFDMAGIPALKVGYRF